MSYYDNGFDRAQQLYDRQEPDYGYEYPWCEDYGYLLGDLEFAEVVGPELCPFCPMKHRCPDGIMTIVQKRENVKLCIDEEGLICV